MTLELLVLKDSTLRLEWTGRLVLCLEVMNIIVEPGWIKWEVPPRPVLKESQLLPGNSP